MIFLRQPSFIHALAVTLLVLVGCASASSSPPRPHKRIAHPSVLALEILPRRSDLRAKGLSTRQTPSQDSPTLLHSDSLRLTLSAFDDTFHLHLRPNDHLIHPAASINYYRSDPSGQSVLYKTEPLIRENVRAYWGEVISSSHSPARLREDAAGLVRGSPSDSELGWARIMVNHQGDVSQGQPPVFEGAFTVNGVVHHVMTVESYLQSKHRLDPGVVSANDPEFSLVIFRDSDMMSPMEAKAAQGRLGLLSPFPARPPQSPGCSHDSLSFNTDPWQNPVLRKPVQPSWYNPFGLLAEDPWKNATTVEKRDDVAGGGSSSNFQSSIGQTTGCPQTQKIVYMGVAADCEYTQNFGSGQNATMKIINDWNMASSLYKTTFNVSLGILKLEIHDPTCPSPPDATRPWNVPCGNVTLNERLSLFSAYRGTLGEDGAGLWHLMSGCPTDSEVGIAWLGTLCQFTATGSAPSVFSGTAVSTFGKTEWQVISHEIGHNFGAIHDCTDGCTFNQNPSCCPMTATTCDANGAFIMNPDTSPNQTHFSPCSIGNVCSLMQASAANAVNTTCLQDPNPSIQTLSLNMCGNGIVENGEECDPGVGVNSTCCDQTTCKFVSGAVCDPASSPCCTGTCTFAPATRVCRPAISSQCDTAEVCTGNSSACPADVFAPNGQSCGNGLACASGHCTSNDQQCANTGASLNLTAACQSKDSTCQISCQDPKNPNQCVQLQSDLIDGSPCGYGGTCQLGNCKAGSLLDTVKAWYTQNLQLSIPLTVIAAIFLFLILWGVIAGLKGCCNGRRRPRATMEPTLVRQKAEAVLSRTGTQRSYGSNNPYVSRSGTVRSAQSGQSSMRSDGVSRANSSSSQGSQRRAGRGDRMNASWGGAFGGSGGSRVVYNADAAGIPRNQADWVDARLYNGMR